MDRHSPQSETLGRTVLHLNDLQDTVETALIQAGFSKQAKHFILYRKERDQQRGFYYDVNKIADDVETPWGPLGYVTFKRTYARQRVNGSGESESFRETILRVLDACQRQLDVGFSTQELKRYYKHMMQLKGSVGGRFLWQLGTKTVERLGIMSLQNCAFVKIDEPIEPFCFMFDVLMLGVGCGTSVEHHNVSKLPLVLRGTDEFGLPSNIEVSRQDTKDANYIVPDSREGFFVFFFFFDFSSLFFDFS